MHARFKSHAHPMHTSPIFRSGWALLSRRCCVPPQFATLRASPFTPVLPTHSHLISARRPHLTHAESSHHTSPTHISCIHTSPIRTSQKRLGALESKVLGPRKTEPVVAAEKLCALLYIYLHRYGYRYICALHYYSTTLLHYCATAQLIFFFFNTIRCNPQGERTAQLHHSTTTPLHYYIILYYCTHHYTIALLHTIVLLYYTTPYYCTTLEPAVAEPP